MIDNNNEYFEYLKGRSRLGLFYRKHLLYPRLSRELSRHVLDIGCGVGDFLAYRPGTTGVDINPQLVEFCTSRGLNARVMSPDKLPFDDTSFDSMILDNVLEHIADPQQLLKEIWRVMRPNGQLVVGVPGLRGYASDPDHKIYYSEKDLTQLFISNGWDLRKSFATPVRSTWLDKEMRQYCVYATFGKPD